MLKTKELVNFHIKNDGILNFVLKKKELVNFRIKNEGIGKFS